MSQPRFEPSTSRVMSITATHPVEKKKDHILNYSISMKTCVGISEEHLLLFRLTESATLPTQTSSTSEHTWFRFSSAVLAFLRGFTTGVSDGRFLLPGVLGTLSGSTGLSPLRGCSGVLLGVTLFCNETK